MGYSYGLTPHCAEYLYQADGTLRCIRRAQREDELFSTLDENPDFTAPAETPSNSVLFFSQRHPSYFRLYSRIRVDGNSAHANRQTTPAA